MNNFEVTYNGVKIAAKILNIPVPYIRFFGPSEISNKEITGMYLYDSDEIVFSEYWIHNSPWIEVIVTAFHESRHAYQGYCVKNRLFEVKETIDKWNHEFINYKRPSERNNAQDDEEYLRQTIEIDAIRFTHHKIYEFFGIRTFVPKSIKEVINLLNHSIKEIF